MVTMKIFKPQLDPNSYTRPLLKISLYISIYLITFWRDRLFPFENEWCRIALGIVLGCLAIASIYGIYVAIYEIYCVYKNRNARPVSVPSQYKQMEKADIFAMMKQNDIIEFEIVVGDKILKIGSSSDCKNSSCVFFDKRYYIDNVEYEQWTCFEDAWKNIDDNEFLNVISIDGLS